jgi:hypothetical protein
VTYTATNALICLATWSCLYGLGTNLLSVGSLDLLRKSGEIFYLKEDLDDEAEAVN